MLVLTRKRGEQVVIGDGITLTVVAVRRDRVRLGIDAPEQVGILRAELACQQGRPPEPPSGCGAEAVRPPR